MLHLRVSLIRLVSALVVAAILAAACSRLRSGLPERVGKAPAPQITLTRFVPPPFPTRVLPATATPAPTPLPSLGAPLVWYLRGTPPRDLDAVSAQLNRVLDARGFNARIVLRPIEPARFDRRMAEIRAAGEAWDLVSLTGSRYADWSAQGLLLPLAAYPEDRLKQSEPDLWASLPPSAWQAARVNGIVYAVPNPGAWARARGVFIRADVVEALGLQPALSRLRAPDDLTPLLAQIQSAWQDGTLAARGVLDAKKINSLVGQAGLLYPELAGYDLLVEPFVVRYDDASLKVVNWYQTLDFQSLVSLRRTWQKSGYLPGNALDPDAALQGYRSGRYLVIVGAQVYPGSAADWSARTGYTWVDYPLAAPFLRTQVVCESLTGINAHISGDPERVRRARLLIEWLHTDPGLYNLLARGIQGQHWNWASPGQAWINLSSGSGYLPDYADQLGDSTLLYAIRPGQQGLEQAVRQSNASTPASAALGFRFNPVAVSGEVLAAQGLLPELLTPLAAGQVRDIPSAVDALNKALTIAGAPAIQQELARQLAEFKASR